jgi:hypothetical protein
MTLFANERLPGRALVSVLILFCISSTFSGCGDPAGSAATNDPVIDASIKAVSAGQEDPKKVRMLLKEKLSGKPQEKAIPPDPRAKKRKPG